MSRRILGALVATHFAVSGLGCGVPPAALEAPVDAQDLTDDQRSELLAMEEGGTVTFANGAFADNPGQAAASTARYTRPTSPALTDQNQPEALFNFDSSAKATSLLLSSAFTQSLLSQTTPEPECKRFNNANPPPPANPTEPVDVGEKVTLSFPGKPDFVILKSTTPGKVRYFAKSPERSQIPAVYRVAVSGREGLDTTGYNGSFLRTLPPPTVRTPSGIDQASPVKLNRSKALRVEWNPIAASRVQIQINDSKFEKGFTCKVPDTGRFTVPVEFMQELAASGVINVSQFATSFAVLEGRRVTHNGASFRNNEFIAE
jgi:hypothetical protein